MVKDKYWWAFSFFSQVAWYCWRSDWTLHIKKIKHLYKMHMCTDFQLQAWLRRNAEHLACWWHWSGTYCTTRLFSSGTTRHTASRKYRCRLPAAWKDSEISLLDMSCFTLNLWNILTECKEKSTSHSTVSHRLLIYWSITRCFNWVSIQQNRQVAQLFAPVNGALYLYVPWCGQVYLVPGFSSYGFITHLK